MIYIGDIMRNLIIVFCLSLILLTSCSNMGDNSSYNENETLINHNEIIVTEIPQEISYERAKEILGDAYSYITPGVYSYNYIFFENGDYIIINFDTLERYTQENSSAKYFISKDEYGEFITVKLSHKNGTEWEIYATKGSVEYPDSFFIATRTNDTFTNIRKRNDVNRKRYSLEDFKSVLVGETSYNDLWNAGLNPLIYISPIGDIEEYPLEGGGYLRLMFDEKLIVKSIEIVDEMAEVYF